MLQQMQIAPRTKNRLPTATTILTVTDTATKLLATAPGTVSDATAAATARRANLRRLPKVKREATEVGAEAGVVNILADTHVVIEEEIETEITTGEAVLALGRALLTAITGLVILAGSVTTTATTGVARRTNAVRAARPLAHGILLRHR